MLRLTTEACWFHCDCTNLPQGTYIAADQPDAPLETPWVHGHAEQEKSLLGETDN